MTKTHTLIIGAVLTAILFALVEFEPGASWVVKALAIAFAWVFLSYGVWSFAGLAQVPGDFRAAMKRKVPARRPISTIVTAATTAADVTLNAILSPEPAPPDVAPEPTDEDIASVRAILDPMAAAGIFQPQVPDPALLCAGVAGWGDSIAPDAIFGTLGELHYYHPDVDAAEFMANLAFVDSKTEQDAALLRSYIAEFDALTGGALGIQINAIDHPSFAEMAGRDVAIDLTIGGAASRIQYRGLPKYLSTHLHVALARAYHALGRGDAIATYWTDQGVWLMRLSDGAVERLNAALELKDNETADPFGWLHAEEPFAASAI